MSVPDKSIDPRLLASAEVEFLDKGFINAELKTIYVRMPASRPVQSTSAIRAKRTYSVPLLTI